MTIQEFHFEDLISRIDVDANYDSIGRATLYPKVRIHFSQGTTLELRSTGPAQIEELMKLMMDRRPFEVKLVPK